MDIMRDIKNTDEIKPETKPKDDDLIITCDLCGSNFLKMPYGYQCTGCGTKYDKNLRPIR